MDIGSALAMGTALSFAVEKTVEVAKIGYLQLKKGIFPNKEYKELTPNEKIIMTVLIAVGGMLICGRYASFQIPGIKDLPFILQSIIYGLMLSVGSGVWHTLYNIFQAMKNNWEKAANETTSDGQ
jgi:hypothetical protein